MNKHKKLEIMQMLKERLKTPKEDYIEGIDVMKRLNLSFKIKEIKCTKKN